MSACRHRRPSNIFSYSDREAPILNMGRVFSGGGGVVDVPLMPIGWRAANMSAMSSDENEMWQREVCFASLGSMGCL